MITTTRIFFTLPTTTVALILLRVDHLPLSTKGILNVFLLNLYEHLWTPASAAFLLFLHRYLLYVYVKNINNCWNRRGKRDFWQSIKLTSHLNYLFRNLLLSELVSCFLTSFLLSHRRYKDFVRLDWRLEFQCRHFKIRTVKCSRWVIKTFGISVRIYYFYLVDQLFDERTPCGHLLRGAIRWKILYI